jgi:AraC family transcriptional regulator
MQNKASEHPGVISPDQLTNWVSGEMLSDSTARGWKGMTQRTYNFRGQDVDLPPLDSFKIVQYIKGTTPMDRKIDGRWTRTECGPGHFSLLSRATETQWNWTAGLIVSHVYLSDDLMRRVALDVQGKADAPVELHDVLQAADPVISFLMDQIRNEAKSECPAGPLYAESLSIQLAVHLLRKYASFAAPSQRLKAGLSQRQLNLLEEYIAAHLQDPITLNDLARLLDIGIWTFIRRVKLALGNSACTLIQERRIERARTLLASCPSMPIKEVAAACGFSDQAHLTRAFRARLDVTPAKYRQQIS